MLLFRLIFSTAIVLIITGLAQPRAHTVLKNFPRGLWTVLTYSLTISWAYSRFGVYLGTLLGYFAATAVLLLVNWKVFFQSRANALRLVRSQESGVRSQESGVRSQESGVRSQESGVRSQESDKATVFSLSCQ
jgi:hypothetical protein